MSIELKFIDSIHQVSASEWDALCVTDYPFIRHAFLSTLEDSLSTHAKNGWQIAHLVAYENQQLIAAMPGYIKYHSYGEYVFDWAWADAYKRYGMDYYPKWINAIPFTPCTGQRLLIAKDYSINNLLEKIVPFLKETCQLSDLSGWHGLFSDDQLHQALNQQQIDCRLGVQFHWFNKNYKHFDDFLSQLTSRKRKNIRKERQEIIDQQIQFETKEGSDISEEDMQLFFRFYCNTYHKRSGHAGYLTANFFSQIRINLAENLLLIQATKESSDGSTNAIAASLFFRDQQTLYGRYWGCFEDYQFLHFETCYYQGIDYAIANQLKRFDGGAQGEHKIARGFEPVFTYSHHWLKAPEFQTAIQHFLIEEAEAVKAYADEAAELLPFKQEK